jgi:hypothetical protein
LRLGEQSARHNTDADALALVMALVVIGAEAVRPAKRMFPKDCLEYRPGALYMMQGAGLL